MKEKAIVSWSGGKDSALALLEAQRDFEIVALLTTVTEGYDRISVHGVRTALLERQADSLQCALEKVVIPRTCSNDEYEARMREGLDKFRTAGVLSVVCGDNFLEDVRRYREERLFTDGLKGVFPLWGAGHDRTGPPLHRPGVPGRPLLRRYPRPRPRVRCQ